MKPTINGTRNAIIRSTNISFDPVRGLILERDFESAGDNLAGVAAQLRLQRVAHTWNRNKHHSSLRATYSGGQDGLPDESQVNWQLFANELQKDIFLSTFADRGVAIYEHLLTDVRRAKSFKDDDGPNSPDAAAIRTHIASTPAIAPALTYYDKLLHSLDHGQTSFGTIQWVLKFSGTISNFYNGAVPGQSGAGTVYFPSTILGFALPNPIRNMIETIEAPDSVSGFTWGWRQLGSTATTTAHNRVEISTEWWLDLWNNNYYPVES